MRGSSHSEGIALVENCRMNLQASKLPYLSGECQATDCCTLLVSWLSSPQHAWLPVEMQKHKKLTGCMLNERSKTPKELIEYRTPVEYLDRQAEMSC